MCNSIKYLVMLGLVFTFSAHANDFEAEAEEVMLESDATSEQAKLAKQRAARERAELAKAKKDASTTQMRAEIRKRHSADELAEADKEEQALIKEKAKHVKAKAAAEKEMAVADAKLKAGMAKLEKTKGEVTALRQLREEQKTKLSQLANQIRENQAQNGNAAAELEKAKKEFKAGQAEEAKKQAEVAKTAAETAKRKQQIQTQIEGMKAQYKTLKEKTLAAEAQVNEGRKGLARKEDEVKFAETEVKQSEGRLADADQRLAAMKTESKAKEMELDKRKAAAERTLQSHEAKQAKQKMDEAQYGQNIERANAASDTTPVQVDMRKTAGTSAASATPTSKATLTKDCQVYEQPSNTAKILGTKKAGTAFTAEPAAEGWMSFKTAKQKQVFVPKDCF